MSVPSDLDIELAAVVADYRRLNARMSQSIADFAETFAILQYHLSRLERAHGDSNAGDGWKT